MNQRNFGIAEGRLTRDAVVFANKDGSGKTMVTLAVDDNFKRADGTRGVQFLSFEGFIRKDGKTTVYDRYMKKGNLVSIQYSLRTNTYEKDGQTVHRQYAFIEGIELKAVRNKDTNVDNNKEEGWINMSDALEDVLDITEEVPFK